MNRFLATTRGNDVEYNPPGNNPTASVAFAMTQFQRCQALILSPLLRLHTPLLATVRVKITPD